MRARPVGVNVNLATGAVGGSHAMGDTISGFENVTGSAFGDNLRGNNGANRLAGGQGGDQLFGGFGQDVFVFEADNGADTIQDFLDLGPDIGDQIDLSAFGLSGFEELTITSDGRGIDIDLTDHGGGTIRLPGFEVDDLDATDFIF